MTLGDNIKKYRKENKLTQMELATLTNKSKSTIEKYESNKVTPSLKILDKIAQALDVTRDELMGSPQIDNIKTSHIDLSKIPTSILLKEIERRCLK